MKILAILITIAIVGSLQSTVFAGRVVTIGDFVFLAIIPLIAYFVLRQAAKGSRVFGATEISMACLLGLLPLTAYLAGMLGNGTFLNGYRSLGFALFLYLGGRLIASEGQVILVCALVFSSVGYVLYQSGASIADFRYGQDVTHLVGYEGEGLGNTINNLNLFGMLWCSIACLSVPFAHALSIRKSVVYALLPSLLIALVVPGVLSSFSRSAYIYYLVVLIGFYYVQIRSGRGITSFFMPIMAAVIVTILAFISFSKLDYSTIVRITDKLGDLADESRYRLNELLIAPLAEFLSDAPVHSLFIGTYNQPQHSSASHYFVMFGFFGFILYAVFQINLILDGFRLAREYGSKKSSTGYIAIFSSFLCIYLLANDLATNLLYYSPTFCYLTYFVAGLCRPYPSRYAI